MAAYASSSAGGADGFTIKCESLASVWLICESPRPLWLSSWLRSTAGADAAGGRGAGPHSSSSDSDQRNVSNGALAFALRRARCLYNQMGHTRGPNITHARIQAFELPSLIPFLLTKKQA